MVSAEVEEILTRNVYWGIFKKNKTSVTLVNNTLKNQDITVPASQTWTVLRGRVHNGDDVARNCNVICYDSVNVEMQTLDADVALGAGAVRTFPRANQSGAEENWHQPVVLEAGDYVRFQFKAGGASTGGTSVIMLHVLARPVA